MALYLIGDLQGCDAPLQRLLAKIDFSPSRDTLYFLGDLVNRGPDSLAVLRRLQGYGTAARCLLGNHDLHLLAVSQGVRRPGRKDTLGPLLAAPDREALLGWLRLQDMAMYAHGCLMVHAGVLPSWSVEKTMALAGEVQAVLRSDDWVAFLHQMYGNTPVRWSDALTGTDRLRMVVNALTRLRFCTADDTMEFESTAGLEAAPPGFMPWFEVPGRQTAKDTVAFGHWSTVGWLGRSDVLSMDTGCVWGGCLSALRLGAAPDQRALIQVDCEQAQKPGEKAS
jgi:bis(5'-nucleosyl)-tetraphosphatase (symmetrical)